jgi:hypothetical protein
MLHIVKESLCSGSQVKSQQPWPARLLTCPAACFLPPRVWGRVTDRRG